MFVTDDWSPKTLEYSESRDEKLALVSPAARLSDALGGEWTVLGEYESRKISNLAELACLLQEVVALRFVGEEDEQPPTEYGVNQCLKILLSLAEAGVITRPTDVVSDVNGDIRIGWRSGHREVELVSPADESEKPYVYHSFGKDFGAEHEVGAETIQVRLQELYSA